MENNHFEESRDSFKVKFEGGNSIDAELFIKTINHTMEIIKGAAKAIDSDAHLSFEIKANKEGSFETIANPDRIIP